LGLDGATGLIGATGIGLNGATGSTGPTGAGVAGLDTGGVLYATSASTLDTDSLFTYDPSTHALGLGTDTPTSRFHVVADAANELPTYEEVLYITGWTSTGWTGSWVNGWSHTTGNTSVLSNSTAAVVGDYYLFTWVFSGYTAGSVAISFGGESAVNSGGTSVLTASGNSALIASAVTGLQITPTSTFDGTISISISHITATSNAVVAIESSDGTVVQDIRGHSASIFLGRYAGYHTLTGSRNTFIGEGAGNANVSQVDLTYVGWHAGYGGIQNIGTTIVGSNAGLGNLHKQSAIFGGAAMGSNSYSAWYNTSIGCFSFNKLTSGNHNTGLG